MSALIGDKGSAGDELRAAINNHCATPVIPNKSNLIVLHKFSKRAYKGRNVIERCFCRLTGNLLGAQIDQHDMAFGTTRNDTQTTCY